MTEEEFCPNEEVDTKLVVKGTAELLLVSEEAGVRVSMAGTTAWLVELVVGLELSSSCLEVPAWREEHDS